MKSVVVLGAGMVGRVMAADLAGSFDVTAYDINQDNLDRLSARNIRAVRLDLSDPAAIRSAVGEADLVVGAVPGKMGFETLKAVLEAGKNVVDISFFPEDVFLLNKLAGEKKTTAVVDCGVAPGMSNMILGYHHRRMRVRSFRCYVGGLPVKRDYPFEYKAPFSPADVIEEYIRPARFVENGGLVTRPALSDPELLNFPEVGTLEAFNSDGLRSLLKTMDIPFMIEKTLRYPGHVERIRTLRESGFFDRAEIDVGGVKVSPLEVTSRILFKAWRLGEEEEFTIMRVLVEGEEEGGARLYEYSLFDKRDAATGFSSMARTTGYPATAVARLILDGRFRRIGICPPEYIGEDESCFRFVLDCHRQRRVIYKIAVKNLRGNQEET